jgi:hypothetical protein
MIKRRINKILNYFIQGEFMGSQEKSIMLQIHIGVMRKDQNL